MSKTKILYWFRIAKQAHAENLGAYIGSVYEEGYREEIAEVAKAYKALKDRLQTPLARKGHPPRQIPYSITKK